MKTTHHTRSIWKAFGLVGAMVVSASLLMPATLADNGHGRKNHHKKNHKRHDGHARHHVRSDNHGRHHVRHDSRVFYGDVRVRPHRAFGPRAQLSFSIPARIHRRDRHDYRPYFRGDFYYAPHRHSHVLYSFPVYGEYGTRYVDRYYCDGELYREPRHRPRVSFGISF